MDTIFSKTLSVDIQKDKKYPKLNDQWRTKYAVVKRTNLEYF